MHLILQSRQTALLLFTLFLNLTGFGMVYPLLSVLIRELGGAPLILSLWLTIWNVPQFALGSVWGTLSDRYGRRPILITGLTGMSIMCLLTAWAPNIYAVLGAALVGAILSSATGPTAQAFLADVVSRDQRGQAMVLNGASQGLGLVMGPVVGVLLVSLGPRGTFLAAGLSALLNLTAVYLFLKEPSDRDTAILPVGDGLRMMATIHRRPWAPYMYTLFLMATCGSILFALMGLLLIDKLTLTEKDVGIAFIVQGAASVVVQMLFVPPVMARFGHDRTLLIACLCGAAGFALLTAAPDLWTACAGISLATASFALIRPTVAAVVSLRTDLPMGLTMGVQSAFDAFGRTVGPLLGGLFYSWNYSAPFLGSAVIYAGLTLFLYQVLLARRGMAGDA